MSFGLDIGSSGVRCLHRADRALRGRRAPACYITLPNGTAEKLLLQRAFIPFSACDGSYLVFGDNAIELSQALKVPLIPVFPEGRLPVDDPVGRQVAATLIESVLPRRELMAGPSAMIVPGSGVSAARNPHSLETFADRVLTLRGAQCVALSAGTASILAELSDREFTGVGLSVGASSTSLSIAVHGQPVAELSCSRGCDGVDDTFARSRGRYFFDSAGNRYLDVRAVARWRETSGIDLASPQGDDQELLRSLVREWLLGAMAEFTQRLEALPAAVRSARHASALVVTGGPSRMSGFDVLVADSLRRSQLPLKITEIRTGSSSEYALARGCLIAAELERQVETRRAA